METTDQKLTDAINQETIHYDEFGRYCLLESKPRGYQNLDDSDILIPNFGSSLRSTRRELDDFEAPVA